MIWVIFGLSIGLIVIGFALSGLFELDVVGGFAVAIGFVASVISIIAIVCLCVSVSNYRVIDEKIAMYQEENTKIEEQVAETVKQYQQYEADIFAEVAPDSAITLVALYPELKADTLVQSQVDVYIKNNEKIKSLKEDKINGTINKWWLYFGS